MVATLSLAMIVKNEEKTIERVLNSARPVCDEMVVADTGSTDATQRLAEQCGAKVVSVPWTDHFAEARNASFAACQSDWILWLDADDVLPEASQKAILHLKQTVLNQPQWVQVFAPYHYSFNASNVCDFTLQRERLIRNHVGCVWRGVVHEYVETPTHQANGEPYQNYAEDSLVVEHRQLPELRQRKVDRNITLLHKAYQSGDRTSRTLFYYANELKDHRRHEEALARYEEYLSNPGCQWEQYQAMLQAAYCCSALNQSHQTLEWGWRAIRLDPTRAEAWNAVGIVYYKQQLWQQAIPYFTAAAACPRPVDGFVHDADYTWMPGDYLSICYDRLGQYRQAIEHSLATLPMSPEPERLRKNLHWLIDQL
ncbi:MAG: glycosyltransferase [Vampirovibrionales bacterium]